MIITSDEDISVFEFGDTIEEAVHKYVSIYDKHPERFFKAEEIQVEVIYKVKENNNGTS